MNRTQSSWLVGLVLFGFLWAAVAWATYSYVTTQVPGANDFYQRWNGAQYLLVQGIDPYSTPVTTHAELYLYGHPYDPNPALDEYPGDFLYPFHLVLVLAPLVNLSYAWASAIWLALIGVGTGAVFLLLADQFNWRLRPLMLAVGIVWALSFYPVTRGLFLGQVGVVAVFLQLISLWALTKRKKALDVVAGAALLVSTIKPQLGLLLYPFLLLWGVRSQRWWFLFGFSVSAVLLIGPAFAMQPNWLAEWLPQASAYSGYTRAAAPLEMITHVYFPFLGSAGQLALIGLLLILLAWAWYKTIWQRQSNWFDWTVALTLVITNLVLVRTATPHYVAFLFIIVFYFRQLAKRKSGTGLVLLGMLLLNVALWLFFLVTVTSNIEAPVMQLPLPISLLILLLFTKALWTNAAPKGSGDAASLSNKPNVSTSPAMITNAA